ncbi:hypothetical protein F4810DRAFT_713653 [Camillea tinctor]|nr:hypothetical protein F4810DRAFT_713653 [Camillea tinctor]
MPLPLPPPRDPYAHSTLTLLTSRLIHWLIHHWHSWLDLPQHPSIWYHERLREEIQERVEAQAQGGIAFLSETADVYYTISRASHNGYQITPVPFVFRARAHALPYLYMVAKFTSRCAFYRVASRLAGGAGVREVVNPLKAAKRHEVAMRHGMDPARFQRVCRRLLKVWPIFP